MRVQPKVGLRCFEQINVIPKRRWFMETAGRWPWKSELAKECVTTHLPNGPALKMDCARICSQCPAEAYEVSCREAPDMLKNLAEKPSGACLSADLDGSSSELDI